MKKLITLAFASSALATSAFAAGSDSQDFTINATVPQECSMEDPTDIDLNVLINTDPGSDALLINTVAQSDVQEIWMSCNYAADISITTANRALETTSPVTDTTNFTNEINYGISLVPSTSGAFAGFGSFKPRVQPPVKTNTQTSEFHDLAQLSVSLEALNVIGKSRPVAGVYTDTVTITLGTT